MSHDSACLSSSGVQSSSPASLSAASQGLTAPMPVYLCITVLCLATSVCPVLTHPEAGAHHVRWHAEVVIRSGCSCAPVCTKDRLSVLHWCSSTAPKAPAFDIAGLHLNHQAVDACKAGHIWRCLAYTEI